MAASPKLETVLFIDDRIESFGKVVEDFTHAGTAVVTIEELAELDEFLPKGQPFDGVILDWFFGNPDNADLAKLCLTKIKERRFVPVYIWTENKGHFEETFDEGDFPRSCITCRGKDEVSPENVRATFEEWYLASVPARLATAWRSAGAASLEGVLYALAGLSRQDALSALRVIVKGEDAEEVDVEHTVTMLERLFHRQLVKQSPFREALLELLKEKPAGEGGTAGAIWNLHMYYDPQDQLVRNGDIVRWKQAGEGLVGLVVTPWCDLAQPKTEFLRIIRLRESTKTEGRPDDRVPLPYVSIDGKLVDKEARFHEVATLCNLSVAEEIKQKEKVKQRRIVMRYSHEYLLSNGEKGTLERLSRLDDPYRSDLIQKFVSHGSRIGTPDVR